MFDASDDGLESVADILAGLRDDERVVAAARARQVRGLRCLSRRGFDLGFSDLAGGLDVSLSTARALLEAARRTPEKSEAMTWLTASEWSFDRTAAIASLVGAGVDETTLRPETGD